MNFFLYKFIDGAFDIVYIISPSLETQQNFQ